ncbi:hypothetical protein BLA6863_07573 [Burkholderia lata]|uniref:Uncharacterized protein n=1 Tax=Burkholderia lata (strain ATCC 17760 / DSM 23089 / LMG 22485 / NCIMB 9086 / R18194 / 383) TaxID=482957 RepID=A0A6P2SRV0_BURL3|nr:hypothetical protein BLA6863_07573 [Burkholderia lata]
MDPECGARAEETSGGRPTAGTAAGARLTYNTPKNTRTGASALATAKRRPARAPRTRQATAATLLRDGETSGTSNTS